MDVLIGFLLIAALALIGWRPDLLSKPRPIRPKNDAYPDDAQSSKSPAFESKDEDPEFEEPGIHLNWDECLRALSTETSRSGRRSVFRALIDLDDPRQDSTLVDFLASDDSHLRHLALAFALRKDLSVRRFPMTKKDGPIALEKTLIQMAEGWGRTPDSVAVLNIAQRQKNPDLEALVLNLGRRDSQRIRNEVVEYVHELGTPKALPLLIEFRDRQDQLPDTMKKIQRALDQVRKRHDLQVGQLSIAMSDDLSGGLSTAEDDG